MPGPSESQQRRAAGFSLTEYVEENIALMLTKLGTLVPESMLASSLIFGALRVLPLETLRDALDDAARKRVDDAIDIAEDDKLKGG